VLRLIGTGSRHATEAEHLDVISRRLHPFARRGTGVYAHGDAPGFDRISARLFAAWGWQIHPIPADWDTCAPELAYELGGCPARRHRRTRPDGTTFCPRAGNRRNQVLADLAPRADLAVGFPAIGSAGRSGTWDALARFVDAGIDIDGVYPLAVTRRG